MGGVVTHGPCDVDLTIDPARVFDLTLPLEQAADRYTAMDQRTATTVLLAL